MPMGIDTWDSRLQVWQSRLTVQRALQEDRSKLDERMMQSVKRASKDADAMLVIVDASDRPAQALTFLASTFEEASVPLAVVLNKVCLLVDSWCSLPSLTDV